MIEHEIRLDLASGARLAILYFSDRAQRWVFSYRYVGDKKPGAAPEICNDVQLVANYADGLLAPQLVLSMHVVVPSRLGKQFYVGVDISPGGEPYLEVTCERVLFLARGVAHLRTSPPATGSMSSSGSPSASWRSVFAGRSKCAITPSSSRKGKLSRPKTTEMRFGIGKGNSIGLTSAGSSVSSRIRSQAPLQISTS